MKSLLFLAILVPSALAGVELVSEEQEEGSLKELTDEEQENIVSTVHHMSPAQLVAMHKKMDLNEDGNVSKAEMDNYAHGMRRKIANSHLDKVMKAHDTDGNGKIDLNEFIGELHKFAAGEEREGDEEVKQKNIEHFKEIDLNHDGQLDADELPLRFHHHTNDLVEERLATISLKQKDVNGDGVLSPEEFWSHMYGSDGARGSISFEQTEEFAQLDKDGSGTLNLEEVKAFESGKHHTDLAMVELFEAVDQDHDSLLSAYELLQAQELISGNQQAHTHVVNWHVHREL